MFPIGAQQSLTVWIFFILLTRLIAFTVIIIRVIFQVLGSRRMTEFKIKQQ